MQDATIHDEEVVYILLSAMVVTHAK